MTETRTGSTTRAQQIAAHPGFPWLEAGDTVAVAALLGRVGALSDNERVLSCDKAGEGNMNLTLRVVTDRRSVILKQARPWVEKYDRIAAPWDRMLFEQRFYKRAASIEPVARRMPRLLGADAPSRVILLEDLAPASDLFGLYAGGALDAADARAMARWLAALHDATAGEPDPKFANREMRALNHAHLFEVPLDAGNGLDVDALEPGLGAAAAELRDDAAYRGRVADAGQAYLADGDVLLHGDFFPGSWMVRDGSFYVIDPEFCFYGPRAFDLGVLVAHLALSAQPWATAEAALGAYRDAAACDADAAWVGRFAGMEVMRRLIGVAQLPIERPEGFRSALLRRSRRAVLRDDVKELWT